MPNSSDKIKNEPNIESQSRNIMTINALIPNTNNNNNIAHTENIPIQQRQIPLAFNKQYGQAILILQHPNINKSKNTTKIRTNASNESNGLCRCPECCYCKNVNCCGCCCAFFVIIGVFCALVYIFI